MLRRGEAAYSVISAVPYGLNNIKANALHLHQNESRTAAFTRTKSRRDAAAQGLSDYRIIACSEIARKKATEGQSLAEM